MPARETCSIVIFLDKNTRLCNCCLVCVRRRRRRRRTTTAPPAARAQPAAAPPPRAGSRPLTGGERMEWNGLTGKLPRRGTFQLVHTRLTRMTPPHTQTTHIDNKHQQVRAEWGGQRPWWQHRPCLLLLLLSLEQQQQQQQRLLLVRLEVRNSEPETRNGWSRVSRHSMRE
jgi:hypothetical protein